MKKTLLFALAVAFIMSVPAFAEVKFSGELDYSAMMNGDETAGAFDKIELDMSAQLDEFNSVAIEIEDDVKSNDIGDVALNVDYATVTTDWGEMLELPFSVVTTMGYEDFYGGDDNYITGWEYEATGGAYLDKEGAAMITLGFIDNMINPFFAYNFDPNDKGDDATEFLAGVNINYDPVIVHYYYVSATKANVDGCTGFDAVASVPFGDGMKLDLSGAFNYSLADSPAAGDEYQYGFGAAFYISDFKVSASAKGNDDQAMEYLGLEAVYYMGDKISFHAAPNFYLGDDSDKDAFVGMTVMAAFKANENLAYKVGYLYSDGNGADSKYVPGAEATTADGGVFVGCEVDF